MNFSDIGNTYIRITYSGINKNEHFNMNPQLTVYKASAGSGKTFTLAREYMTIVINNPQAYRTILAVTFTNKATEEMKIRILSQLYGISKRLPDSASYLEQIQEALPHLSEVQIVHNAGMALKLLLHNYNYFRIETIDTFFQSVLRNLARELDLTANLRIDLNATQVEHRAVDQLIDALEDKEPMLRWIISYIEENIDEDKSWNVIGAIKDFGANIFTDHYKQHAERIKMLLEDEQFYEAFNAELRRMERSVKTKYRQAGERFFQILQENGLSMDDFSNKASGPCGYFIKLKNDGFTDDKLVGKRISDAIEHDEAWVTKANAHPGNLPFDLARTTLRRMLCHTEEGRKDDIRHYNSAYLTLRHINELRLLGAIDKKVRDMNRQDNRFLLCDTQTMLHALIQDSDSPFIFEKIGTQLEHVMIDEFQDTSSVQWQNFKVLMRETMSRQATGNLIVGDVKQSIYRWRAGDWRLLNNIETQFGKENTDIKNLDTNYRSDRNLVDFNNAFFTIAAQKEYEALAADLPKDAPQILSAYTDVEQKVPKDKPTVGYVSIQLLAPKATDEGTTPRERTFQAVKDIIDDLRLKGAQDAQIAVIVRRTKDIQQIAEYLMAQEGEYRLVSDEAFRLEASQAVLAIITALRTLAHPDNNIARATLHKFVDTYMQEEEKEYITDFIDTERTSLLQMPLPALVQRLFIALHLGDNEHMKKQSAYVCALYDYMADFIKNSGSDLDSFLDEWDDNLHDKSIQSDSAEGIRLLTIHKSKGLEYDYVIMPFCEWTLEMEGSTVWCTAEEEPFNMLPTVPLPYNRKKLKDSVYAKDYHYEHLQNMVDNLNLLYVGFTRASHSLFVIGTRSSTNTARRTYTIEHALPRVEEVLADKALQPVTYEAGDPDGDIRFEYGTPFSARSKKKKPLQTSNVFMTGSRPLPVPLPTNEVTPVFKQSNKSRDFIQGDEAEEQQKHYIRMGTVLHQVFSTIRTTADIGAALAQMELDGMLYDENVSRHRVTDMIRKRIESKQVAEWFSDRWTLYNECSILSVEDGKVVEHRPDRVMKDQERTIVVDFKFGKPKDEHLSQVRQYMQLLEGMDGHNVVEGFLWYVYPNKIVKVPAI